MRSPRCSFVWAVIFLGSIVIGLAQAQDADPIRTAQALRKSNQPVVPSSDTTVIAEAEEFQITKPGW
jgi:hypothetical protein